MDLGGAIRSALDGVTYLWTVNAATTPSVSPGGCHIGPVPVNNAGIRVAGPRPPLGSACDRSGHVAAEILAPQGIWGLSHPSYHTEIIEGGPRRFHLETSPLGTRPEGSLPYAHPLGVVVNRPLGVA